MRILVTLIMSLLIAFPGFAAKKHRHKQVKEQTVAPANISINVKLQYLKENLDGREDSLHMNTVANKIANNHEWTVIHNYSGRFILLGKVENADKKQAAIKFLIIDSSESGNIISAPKLVMLYGQEGRISFEDRAQKLQLTVVAKDQ